MDGATAWDRSVAFSIDAGRGNDVYALSRSTRLERANHNLFTFFADEESNDQHQVLDGFVATDDNSTSAFFNLEDTMIMSLDQEITATDTQMGNYCKRQRLAIGRSGRMRKRKPRPSLTSEIHANRMVKTRTFSEDTHSIRSMTRRAETQVFKNVYPARSQAR